MDFAYVATGPSVTVFFGFFFLDFFFRNRPLPKKIFFFFFGEKFCDVEKKNFFLGGREAWEAGPPGREAWASSEPCSIALTQHLRRCDTSLARVVVITERSTRALHTMVFVYDTHNAMYMRYTR